MRLAILVVALSLLATSIVASTAAAENPCGPNVQRCEPLCRTGRIQDCLPDPCEFFAVGEPLPDPCAT